MSWQKWDPTFKSVKVNSRLVNNVTKFQSYRIIQVKRKGPWMDLDLDNPLLAAREMLCTFLKYIRTDYELQNDTCKYFKGHGGHDKTQTNVVFSPSML